MTVKGQILKSASAIALLTAISRICGYLRDQRVALLLGTSPAADSFVLALRIPNLIRRMTGEGSLGASFIPVFTDYLRDKPREQAWRHWAMALAYATKGNATQAKAEAKLMEDSLSEYKEKAKMPVPEVLEVAREELDGHLKLADGKLEPGLKKLDQAAAMELHMMYSEPPYYPRPVLEALGQAALKSGKLPEAESAFRRALEQYPASHRARVGLRAALDRQHKTEAAGF